MPNVAFTTPSWLVSIKVLPNNFLYIVYQLQPAIDFLATPILIIIPWNLFGLYQSVAKYSLVLLYELLLLSRACIVALSDSFHMMSVPCSYSIKYPASIINTSDSSDIVVSSTLTTRASNSSIRLVSSSRVLSSSPLSSAIYQSTPQSSSLLNIALSLALALLYSS